MIKHKIAKALVLAATVVLLMSANPSQQERGYFVHTVAKGESISLLCIQFYGYYSTNLGAFIQRGNPAIKDMNLILLGQKIKFPDPQSPKRRPPDQKPPLAEKRIHATQGVVTYVQGTATLIPKDDPKERALSVNTLVYPGDVIQTKQEARVEIIINRESVVRMKENTRLTVQAFRNTKMKKGKTRVGFSVGTVWSKMRQFKDKFSRFELVLPTVMAGVRGTVYQASCQADSVSEVKVFAGAVAVKNRPKSGPAQVQGRQQVAGPQQVSGPREVGMGEWIEIVRAMQKITIDKHGRPSKPQEFQKNPNDDWEKWNEERDRRMALLFGGMKAR